jgi:sugar phosphate permease
MSDPFRGSSGEHSVRSPKVGDSRPSSNDIKIVDENNGDTEVQHTMEDAFSYLVDRQAEKKIVWKLDTRILPVLAVMYLFNSLDKSNLGNAKTAGLEKSLNLQGNQYNIILSVFFVPYVLTAPILGIVGKKFGPSRVLPIMMLCFGIVTTMMVVVKNFGGAMTVRWFLGMAESAFFPLVIYYQTT